MKILQSILCVALFSLCLYACTGNATTEGDANATKTAHHNHDGHNHDGHNH